MFPDCNLNFSSSIELNFSIAEPHPNEKETSNSILLEFSAAASHCKKRTLENNIRTKARKNLDFVLFGNETMKPEEENFPWWPCCHLLGASSQHAPPESAGVFMQCYLSTVYHCVGNAYVVYRMAHVVCFSNMLSLYSRLTSSQLEKEKAELIHQIEVNKDRTGAGSSTPGNVFHKTCWLSQGFDSGLAFCVFL